MRILKERETVKAVVWFTYVKGYDFDGEGKPRPFIDVLRARVGIAAAQNYLRHVRGDSRLVVTDVEIERTVWACDIDQFLTIAENIEGKTLDQKEI